MTTPPPTAKKGVSPHARKIPTIVVVAGIATSPEMAAARAVPKICDMVFGYYRAGYPAPLGFTD